MNKIIGVFINIKFSIRPTRLTIMNNSLMILPLDIIGIIFEKINSYGLILSLTSKYFNKFYGEINNKTKLEEFLSSMTMPLIKYMWNFQIIHIYKLTVLCEKIAIYGNLEVLKWACANGCPHDHNKLCK